MSRLNAALRAVRAGEITKQDAVNQCVLFLYHHPVLRRLFSLDDLHEFILDLHPRINQLLDRFCLGERPLEAYLVNMARFHVKTFARRRQRENRQRHMMTDLAKYESLLQDSLSSTFEPKLLALPWSRCDRIRVLYLALRSAADLTLPLVKALSDFSGVSVDTIFAWVDALLEKSQARRIRKQTERQKLDRAYARLLGWVYEPDGPGDETRLSKQRRLVAEQRRRYLGYDDRCSHKAIAEVTGVSKGTIDSAIYHVKKKIREFETNDRLESASERA